LKGGKRFDIRGTGCGALGFELLERHFGMLRGWLIPSARSSGPGSAVFAGWLRAWLCVRGGVEVDNRLHRFRHMFAALSAVKTLAI